MHMSRVRSRLLKLIEILQKFKEIELHLKSGRAEAPRRTLEIISVRLWF